MKKTFIISEILLASLFCFAVALSPALAGTITNGFNNPSLWQTGSWGGSVTLTPTSDKFTVDLFASDPNHGGGMTNVFSLKGDFVMTFDVKQLNAYSSDVVNAGIMLNIPSTPSYSYHIFRNILDYAPDEVHADVYDSGGNPVHTYHPGRVHA